MGASPRLYAAFAVAAGVVVCAALLGGVEERGIVVAGPARPAAALARSISELPEVPPLSTDSLEHAVAGAKATRPCESGPAPRWGEGGMRAALEESARLGARFMLEHQAEDGRFTYEFDWRTGAVAAGDSQVRQAGAAWGLALLCLHRPRAAEAGRAREGAMRALAFFRRHSRMDEAGRARFVAYPGDAEGSLGTVALVTLAHVDLLRAMEASGDASSEAAARLYEDLDEYALFLLMSWRADGSFFSRYSLSTGRGGGPPSPYFDGESLLALVRAARYLGRARAGLQAAGGLGENGLWRLLERGADAGATRHVSLPLEDDEDSSQTKGWYQWGSMALHELATRPGARPETAARFAGAVVRMAAWMVDTHRTLQRRRNTAYAYEGIVCAYRLAADRGDTEAARRLGCVIERGLRKLTAWQVGHPLAAALSGWPERAAGGVQNHASESALRIDVVQHQMHAVLLALAMYDGAGGG